MQTGIILLAAGSSSRMGQSKQLLTIKGKPLLIHSVNTAIKSGTDKVVVVLGANETAHRKALLRLKVEIVVNENWKAGMGGSLKAGLKHLLADSPKTETVIVMVCDQPLLTPAHLTKIQTMHLESKKDIVASYYAGTAGVPALFDKKLFQEILRLPDEQGAKKIIQQHPTDTLTINFPEGSVDLDTPQDYTSFQQKEGN